jgi:zinc transport system substrate-binding protein
VHRGWSTALLMLGSIAFGSATAEAGLNVVATTEHYAAIARIVGGDRVHVAYLAKGYQDPRAVEPRASFSVPLNRADVLIVNGQGLEAAWLPTVLTDSTNARLREGKPGYLDASQGAHLIAYDPKELESPFFVKALVAVQAVFGASTSEIRLGNNPYYWLDPANGDSIAKAIVERLALLDLDNADFYRANYARFTAQLQAKLRRWDALMQPFAGAEIVGYRRSWAYVAHRHGLKILGYVEPKVPLVLAPTNLYNPPDREEQAALIAKMRQSRVKLLVAETYDDQALAERIASQAGARLLVLPSSVSQRDGIADYFQLFERIYQELSQALRASGG